MQPEIVTQEDLTAAYKRTNLRRHGIGMHTLLTNPTLSRVLHLAALAAKKKQARPS